MIRTGFLFAVGAALFSLATPASAQIVIPNFPQIQPNGLQKQQLDMLQQQLMRILQQGQAGALQKEQLDLLQQQLQQAFGQAGQFQPGVGAKSAGTRWGGAVLTKVNADMQVKLGLPENEGLLVASVDANSVSDKAGLKANDVLVKVNNKSVPSELTAFVQMVKDQKAGEGMELVIVRDGKQQTLKDAKMPANVQTGPIGKGGKGFGGLGGLGGAIGGIKIQPRVVNPRQPGVIQNLNIEMTVNGAKIIRKQNADSYSGEYHKDNLKITVAGKMELGRAALPNDISITEGKETKKYASTKEVPPQYRQIVQQLTPTAANMLMLRPFLDSFPELPPGILPPNDF